MNKEELTTLPTLQGTSHCSCLEHCFPLFQSGGRGRLGRRQQTRQLRDGVTAGLRPAPARPHLQIRESGTHAHTHSPNTHTHTRTHQIHTRTHTITIHTRTHTHTIHTRTHTHTIHTRTHTHTIHTRTHTHTIHTRTHTHSLTHQTHVIIPPLIKHTQAHTCMLSLSLSLSLLPHTVTSTHKTLSH